jgi:hypothetical protein
LLAEHKIWFFWGSVAEHSNSCAKQLHEYVKSCMWLLPHVAMKIDGGLYNVLEIQQLNDSQIARKLELIQQCHK